jgi:hypothetical protein
MVPTRLEAAQKAYEPGRRYWLAEVSERSWISHQHEFAWIAAAWDTLPESLMDRYPTPEHLRKGALIATGWYREVIIEAGSKEAARRVAAYVKGEDEFSYVIVRGPTVFVRKAKSQRMHGLDRMDKEQFQQSKDAILGWIAQLIGLAPDELMRGAA